MTSVLMIGVMCASCSTSYDTYGNRRQTVDPAGAVIGAVALGALAYSIGKDRGEDREHRRHTRFERNDRNDYYGGRGYDERRGRR